MSAPSDHTLLQQAVAHHQSGRLREAERLYRMVLRGQPDQPDANYHLGLLAVQASRPTAALACFKKALDANPAQPRYWLSYIDALLTAGQPETAKQVLALGRQGGLSGPELDALAARLAQAMRPAQADAPDPKEMQALLGLFNLGRYEEMATQAASLTERYPQNGIAWKALGAALLQQGKNAEALAPLQRAVELLPADAGIHNNLAGALQFQGRLDEAEAAYRRALALAPDDLDVRFRLAKTLQRQQRTSEAESEFRRVLAVKPDHGDAQLGLGKLLWKLLRFSEAEVAIRQLLETAPDCAKAWLTLGNLLQEQSKPVKAAKAFRRVLALEPENAIALCNLGVALQAQGRTQESEDCFRRSLQYKPDSAETYNNLATSLIEQGLFHEGEACLRRALQIRPDYVDAHTNLIFASDMMIGMTPAMLQEERQRWYDAHAAHLPRYSVYAGSRDPERRLRIGYVSADMRKHSAAKVFAPMLLYFDRSAFDVVAYSSTVKEDDITETIRQSATEWRPLAGLSDADVAERIHRDAIDILVDLSGYTDGNRLLAFARKPAPLQINAWGYSCGTGMQTMDVLFADPLLVPPEETGLYAEEVRYLSCALVYHPFDKPPDVGPLPAAREKMLTFGSHNRLAKISDQAYQAWAEILAAVPDSRMLLKTPGLDDAETRKRVLGQFSRRRIDPQRILFSGKTAWWEHLSTFNQVDISLDSFPQSGGVTALESLIMGSPVLAMRWPTFNGRVSASILTALGLNDWIAETPEQYVELAVRKARDRQALAELRQRLRATVENSMIGNARAYVGMVEKEYRQLWREWCVRQ